MPAIESPGSIREFVGSRPELDKDQAQAEYFRELATYRESLAVAVGVSEQELHSMGPSTITQRILSEAGVEVG